jgi:hypothetical protein
VNNNEINLELAALGDHKAVMHAVVAECPFLTSWHLIHFLQFIVIIPLPVMRDDALADLHEQRLNVILAPFFALQAAVVPSLRLSCAGCVLPDEVIQQSLDRFAKLGGIHSALAVAGKTCASITGYVTVRWIYDTTLCIFILHPSRRQPLSTQLSLKLHCPGRDVMLTPSEQKYKR